MTDQLVRLHLKEPDLLVVAVLCTQAAQEARRIHELAPTSAGVFAQGMAAAFGVAGLLHGGSARSHINFQVTCDGPIRGVFVDADAEGFGRGYVKNPAVNFLGSGPGDYTGAFGRNGMLSVLRELRPGDYYRGTVAIEHYDLARDLERYYRESEQIETAVALEVRPDGADPLGRVAGLFVQLMPDADPAGLRRARTALASVPMPEAGPNGPARAFDIAGSMCDLFGGDWELLAEYPLAYRCGCSAERAFRAVLAMGRGEITDILRTEGKAVATCAFCRTVYEVSGEQLQKMLAASGEESS